MLHITADTENDFMSINENLEWGRTGTKGSLGKGKTFEEDFKSLLKKIFKNLCAFSGIN